MSDEYWLADSEARVLGPVGLDVVRDLAVRGKLRDVRAVSIDGRNFRPLGEVPEIQAALGTPALADATRAQAEATRQIREWLAAIAGRATHEVFRVPVTASREAHRAAFFALVHRYVPSRLPPDATPELRLACEDAFLTLSERMVELERAFRAQQKATHSPSLAPATATPPVAPQVSWRGGMIHVRLKLVRGDARAFVADPDLNYKSDTVFVLCGEKVMVGTPAEVTMTFEGHVTQIHGAGLVVGARHAPPIGFGVKLLEMSEDQRSMIRTWVARASPR